LGCASHPASPSKKQNGGSVHLPALVFVNDVPYILQAPAKKGMAGSVLLPAIPFFADLI
jgi:hypothetical protein